jgi:hypothetical protein
MHEGFREIIEMITDLSARMTEVETQLAAMGPHGKAQVMRQVSGVNGLCSI